MDWSPEVDLFVSYPPGSGGYWLLAILYYCEHATPWVNETTNFHSQGLNKNIIAFHDNHVSDSTISINGSSSKYNFWRLYVYKNAIRELVVNSSNKKEQKTYVNLLQQSRKNQDIFFQLVNQCRYIQNYKHSGKFNIEWQDLFARPQLVWQTINTFLTYNNKTNKISYKQFEIALSNYKETCQINFPINFSQKSFQIWCLAYLQDQGYNAPFNVYEYFGSQTMLDWLFDYQKEIVDYTRSNTYCIKS